MRLLDVEGTVCPISFVRDVLFPYARERLAAHLALHPEDRVAVARAAEVDPSDVDGLVAVLTGWIDQDRKAPALKELQGRIWRQGYADGALRAPLYDDVLPAVDRWRAAGEPVAIFSSGSVEAQRLFFGHTVHGDVRDRLAGFFDTEMGSKREPAAYTRIAAAQGVRPAEVTFYSDVAAELDAAVAAGMVAVGVVREGPPPDRVHRWVSTL